MAATLATIESYLKEGYQGRIREQGTHRALLAQQGIYAQMWLLQQQEERV